jgi:hypothetical protein
MISCREALHKTATRRVQRRVQSAEQGRESTIGPARLFGQGESIRFELKLHENEPLHSPEYLQVPVSFGSKGRGEKTECASLEPLLHRCRKRLSCMKRAEQRNEKRRRSMEVRIALWCERCRSQSQCQ